MHYFFLHQWAIEALLMLTNRKNMSWMGLIPSVEQAFREATPFTSGLMQVEVHDYADVTHVLHRLDTLATYGDSDL